MAEPLRGLIVDYGGVLTTDVFASFRAFCAAEGLEPAAVRDAFMRDAVDHVRAAGVEFAAIETLAKRRTRR